MAEVLVVSDMCTSLESSEGSTSIASVVKSLRDSISSIMVTVSSEELEEYFKGLTGLNFFNGDLSIDMHSRVNFRNFGREAWQLLTAAALLTGTLGLERAFSSSQPFLQVCDTTAALR